MTHTELPWFVCKQPANDQWNANQTIGSESMACRVADTATLNANHEADAAFIVRACNSHYELLEALELICDSGCPLSDFLTDKMNAAIAKASDWV